MRARDQDEGTLSHRERVMRIESYHRRLVEAIKNRTSAKVFIHGDGSVYPLLRDFVE